LVYGSTFFSDHEFLGELYPVYESAYDGVIERMIGLGSSPDLAIIQAEAVDRLKKQPQKAACEVYFQHIGAMELELCDMVEQMKSGVSEGTRQMLGTLADESEARQYKIIQRIKK
jgi:DNA-binding ferritin-like protein